MSTGYVQDSGKKENYTLVHILVQVTSTCLVLVFQIKKGIFQQFLCF